MKKRLISGSKRWDKSTKKLTCFFHFMCKEKIEGIDFSGVFPVLEAKITYSTCFEQTDLRKETQLYSVGMDTP